MPAGSLAPAPASASRWGRASSLGSGGRRLRRLAARAPRPRRGETRPPLRGGLGHRRSSAPPDPRSAAPQLLGRGRLRSLAPRRHAACRVTARATPLGRSLPGYARIGGAPARNTPPTATLGPLTGARPDLGPGLSAAARASLLPRNRGSRVSPARPDSLRGMARAPAPCKRPAAANTDRSSLPAPRGRLASLLAKNLRPGRVGPFRGRRPRRSPPRKRLRLSANRLAGPRSRSRPAGRAALRTPGRKNRCRGARPATLPRPSGAGLGSLRSPPDPPARHNPIRMACEPDRILTRTHSGAPSYPFRCSLSRTLLTAASRSATHPLPGFAW